MEESQLWRKIRFCAIKGFVDAIWFVVLFQPLFVWYLWKYWWLRPLIIWYLPWTLFFIFAIKQVVFLLLTNGGKNKILTSLFVKSQTFLMYHCLRVLHGFKVHGVHNVPKGGALIVYYHAPVFPVDIFFMFCYVYLRFGRIVGGSVDFNLYQNFFLGRLCELYNYTSDRRKFIEDLRNGQLRSAAPGGAYESMFSRNYSLEWRSRIGFAKVAKDTGVPVVPMFTTNLQQYIPLVEFNRSDTMKKWYALIKRPLFLPKCYLPVKMHTYLGEPLVCGVDEEPEAFANRVKKAVENLRDKYQPPNQTCWNALKERIW